MKAIVQDRYGSPDVLTLREVDQPTPVQYEVLVRVHAASVNARDWHIMRGDPYLARPSVGFRRPKPAIRGTDFASRAEAVGPNVTRLRPGDEVNGEHPEAFAESTCRPGERSRPQAGQLHVRGGSRVPPAGITALMGLLDVGKVGPGPRVPINGASGGVGTFAVQIAKSLGADVTPCAAPGTSTWSARSARTTSSTTPATTSPPPVSATTSCSIWWATARWPSFGA